MTIEVAAAAKRADATETRAISQPAIPEVVTSVVGTGPESNIGRKTMAKAAGGAASRQSRATSMPQATDNLRHSSTD